MNKGKRIRESMGLTRDTSGQLSIDFLAGVAIFLLAFIFIFAFVPGMFTSFQSNSDELTMTADRASATLVENVLLQSNNEPNVILTSKFIPANLNDPAKLGIGNNRQYNIKITFKSAAPLNYGPIDPTGALNVGQSKRIVVDETGHIGILTVTVW